ncbi:hypothetical protein B0J17DRAFT_639598 [Rhizoctonia solani]|nr:hypothetical protein B0J17DRAFT_639598 [Rhizoctonia solani]
MEPPASSCGLSLSYVSISDLGNDETSPMIMAADPEPNIGAPPVYKGMPLFDPQDGDIQISVNGTIFKTHRYLTKRFQGIKLLLNKQPLGINLQREDISAEDFSEMFKVLYASIITGPFGFTLHTLISTLRVASVFEYHALRDYCVQRLEALELDVVKRIEIAHEFRLTAWENPAYRELGMRDEPITREEAKIIGLDAFVTIAEVREKEQRRRGKEIDAMEVEQDGWSPESVGEVNPSRPPSPHSGRWDINNIHIATCEGNAETQSGSSFSSVELHGTYNWRSKYGYRIEIPSCRCRLIDQCGVEQPDWSCALYPCAISALKDIQAQQLAHANGISSLELSVKKLNATIATIPTAALLRTRPTGLKLTRLGEDSDNARLAGSHPSAHVLSPKNLFCQLPK